ncbi:MAG: DNA repair exonuclease [Deltaproteobacteria bacterium]|nr:DNA repair exonuclease [Deltaproteobacteria bacterium]
MFRFLHAADIHLDSPLRGLEAYPDAPVEQIRGAARRAFDNLIRLAVEEEVAFVLLAGDLYDGNWKDYNTGIFFMQCMGRLRAAGIRVFMIAGNHDAASQLTKSLTLPDNVTLLSSRRPETRVLDDLGVAIHGQGFATRAVAEDLSQSYPAPVSGLLNIGLLHTSLIGRPGHEPYAPCTLEGLRGHGYDYWALGHVHQREILCREPWVVFPGNIQGRHARETGPKGCVLVSADEGRIRAVEHRDLDVLRFAQLDVRVPDDADLPVVYEVVRTAMERELELAQGRPLAARVRLLGACGLHAQLCRDEVHVREELRAVAASLGDVWLERLVLATTPATAATLADSALADLVPDLERLDFDAEAMLAAIPDFRSLRAKLPPELKGEGDPLSFADEALVRLRHDVRELVLSRLLGVRHED